METTNINQANNSIKKGNVEKCQEMLQNGKKLIWIVVREEDRWEVVKWYLFDDLASDLKNEKQVLVKGS